MDSTTEKTQDEGKRKGKKKEEAKDGKVKFAGRTFVNKVPPGQRKDFAGEMADAYYPEEVESSWDTWWSGNGLATPELDCKKENFVIVIPPPNVTGTLHLGHALTCSIEDAVVRWNRMCGKNTLWVPGTDHAGIATQVVVEKKLMKERKITRHDLGREKFLEEVWKWKEANGSHIKNQLRRLGTSVDWTREVFTMDAKCNAAVNEAFVRMFNDGVIYRANRIVTWSCTLKTAISSIEVNYEDIEEPTKLAVPGYKDPVEFGVLHSFAYKFKGSNDEIVVATTRLETMLGDVAVVVHPDDERYKKFHGRKIVHPFIPDREMVLACDAQLVDMNFGTGAVKLTPCHDPNDFDCGKRLGLPMINIFDDDGLVNENGGPFKGQKRFDVRLRLIDEMTKLGIYRGKQPNKMAIGICSRSKDIVEPVVRPQWWVNCDSMAAQAIEKVKSKELQILPDFHEATWFKWLENIRDWCISRQLWWGHRIPAYLVSVDGKKPEDVPANWVVGRTQEDAVKIATERFKVSRERLTLTQDPDVLDTWFSSGLFPFSVMGWPNETPDLKNFFPGQLLETGHDILFFWVARMVMMSLHLTKQLPFKQVFLHAMVRDKFGRKMSKSLGNVVDPIDVIEGVTLQELHDKLLTGNLDSSEVQKATEGQKQDFPEGIAQCGADALRFGLLAYTGQGRNINLDIARVVAYRQFCNKLWNATKFALLSFDASWKRPGANFDSLIAKHGSFADKWILNRLAAAVQLANAGFTNYDFTEATTATYNFWLYDLCDYYLELIKPIVKGSQQGPREAALATLFVCLEYGLRLMHPLMPFLTEELFHRLPGHAEATAKSPAGSKQATGSISVQPYPSVRETEKWKNPATEQAMELLKDLVHTARSTRSSLGLIHRQKCDIHVRTNDKALADGVNSLAAEIGTLGSAEKVVVHSSDSTLPNGCVSAAVNEKITLFLPVNTLVDLVKEALKIAKNRDKLSVVTENLREKTQGTAYAEKTPPETQAEHREKLATQDAQIAGLDTSLSQLVDAMTSAQKAEFWQVQVGEATKELEKANQERAKLEAQAKKEAPTKKLTQSLAAARADVTAAEQKLAQTRKRAGLPAEERAAPVAESKAVSGDSKVLNVAALNDHLATNAYIQGYNASRADAAQFETMPTCPSAQTYPHAARWWNHIGSFSEYVRDRWK